MRNVILGLDFYLKWFWHIIAEKWERKCICHITELKSKFEHDCIHTFYDVNISPGVYSPTVPLLIRVMCDVITVGRSNGGDFNYYSKNIGDFSCSNRNIDLRAGVISSNIPLRARHKSFQTPHSLRSFGV